MSSGSVSVLFEATRSAFLRSEARLSITFDSRFAFTAGADREGDCAADFVATGDATAETFSFELVGVPVRSSLASAVFVVELVGVPVRSSLASAVFVVDFPGTTVLGAAVGDAFALALAR
jgi:hypothetical protein